MPSRTGEPPKRKFVESNSKTPKERYKKKYWKSDRTVKRKIRADKRAHMENIESKAEEAANKERCTKWGGILLKKSS